jgi:hypothetical protein
MLSTAPEAAAPELPLPLPLNAYVVGAAGPPPPVCTPTPLATYAPTPEDAGETTTPPLFTVTTCPLMVTAPEPGTRVVPPMERELPLAV